MSVDFPMQAADLARAVIHAVQAARPHKDAEVTLEIRDGRLLATVENPGVGRAATYTAAFALPDAPAIRMSALELMDALIGRDGQHDGKDLHLLWPSSGAADVLGILNQSNALKQVAVTPQPEHNPAQEPQDAFEVSASPSAWFALEAFIAEGGTLRLVQAGSVTHAYAVRNDGAVLAIDLDRSRRSFADLPEDATTADLVDLSEVDARAIARAVESVTKQRVTEAKQNIGVQWGQRPSAEEAKARENLYRSLEPSVRIGRAAEAGRSVQVGEFTFHAPAFEGGVQVDEASLDPSLITPAAGVDVARSALDRMTAWAMEGEITHAANDENATAEVILLTTPDGEAFLRVTRPMPANGEIIDTPEEIQEISLGFPGSTIAPVVVPARDLWTLFQSTPKTKNLRLANQDGRLEIHTSGLVVRLPQVAPARSEEEAFLHQGSRFEQRHELHQMLRSREIAELFEEETERGVTTGVAPQGPARVDRGHVESTQKWWAGLRHSMRQMEDARNGGFDTSAALSASANPMVPEEVRRNLKEQVLTSILPFTIYLAREAADEGRFRHSLPAMQQVAMESAWQAIENWNELHDTVRSVRYEQQDASRVLLAYTRHAFKRRMSREDRAVGGVQVTIPERFTIVQAVRTQLSKALEREPTPAEILDHIGDKWKTTGAPLTEEERPAALADVEHAMMAFDSRFARSIDTVTDQSTMVTSTGRRFSALIAATAESERMDTAAIATAAARSAARRLTPEQREMLNVMTDPEAFPMSPGLWALYNGRSDAHGNTRAVEIRKRLGTVERPARL
jgi:hypothetical protein